MGNDSKLQNPNSKLLKILLIEDNAGDVDLIREMLTETGTVNFSVESVPRLSEAMSRLKSNAIDLVLLDLGLPDSKGLDTFIKLQAAVPDMPIIILTGNTDQHAAVTAVREGAQDYLIKGQFNGNIITRAIRYAVERKQAQAALRQSEEKYRSLVDNVEIGVSLISPEMKIIALNRKMKNWFPNVDVAMEPVCYRAFNSPPREGALLVLSDVQDPAGWDGARVHHRDSRRRCNTKLPRCFKSGARRRRQGHRRA